MSLTKDNENQKEILITVKRSCDHRHEHCKEIINKYKNKVNILNENFFNSFILMTKGHYNSCLSNYSNPRNCNNIRDFIMNGSQYFKMENWDSIISFFSDEEILTLIKNQDNLDKTFLNKIIYKEIKSSYNPILFINSLINHPTKIKSFEHILMNLKIDDFLKLLLKINKSISSNIENIIIKYINKNSKELKPDMNNNICLEIINNFIGKPQIIKNIYQLISKSISFDLKKDIFNKSLCLLDKELIFLLLENKDIIPNSDTINKLVEKCYPNINGSRDANKVAEIIDLLCEYNLKIDKNIILKLLNHGCYVNNIEKHNIEIDQQILKKCSDISYYPYKFNIIPDITILIQECSKSDNLITIKKLKEYGGNYNIDCLIEACKLKKNSKVIKFLINECNIKINEVCIKVYQETYHLDGLDIIMKNYSDNKSEKIEIKESIHIDEKYTMKIIPNNTIDLDENKEYTIKDRIKKFLNIKKNKIKYIDLFQLMLKYIIDNNLIIGNYFVLNNKLSKFIKLNSCTLININEIKNILTYFIE